MKKLTEAQARAIKTPAAKHAVVVAVAGAGKTTVLEQRIRYLVEQGNKQQLVIKFTKKAAKNITERLGTYPDSIWIGTFHAFCFRLLGREAPDLLRPKFVTDSEEYRLYRAAESSILTRKLNVSAKDCIVRLGQLFKQGFNPNKWATIKESAALNIVAKDIYNSMSEAGYMFFGELPILAFELLMSSQELTAAVVNEFPLVMVDEFQDTDEIQFAILNRLANQGSRVFAVGDESQCIYEWRGCNPEIMRTFSERFNDSERSVLDTNFRSTDHILATANNVLEGMNAPTKMVGIKGDCGPPVRFKRFNSIVEEAAFIAEEVDGRPDKDNIAVLYRSNSQSGALESELAKRRIPFVVSGSAMSFFDLPEIASLLGYLRILSDPEDVDALKYIWNRPNRFLKNDFLRSSAAVLEGSTVFDVLRGAKSHRMGLTQRNKLKELEKFLLCYATQRNRPADIIKTIQREFNYPAYVQSLVERSLTRAQDDIERALTQFEAIAAEFTSIAALLMHVSFTKELMAQNRERKGGVSLSTIHAAKGLEFDTVYLIGAEEGIIPHEKSSLLDEERRLMYVAITRAEETLMVSYYDKPSRYISGMVDAYAEHSLSAAT